MNTAEIAITQRRHATVRNTLDLLREGNKDAALAEMVRGYQKQVRIAGLERKVRESAGEGVGYADEG